jgi:hypothetical protein
MIKYKQHIPAYISGADPEEYTCETLDELLEKNKSCLGKDCIFAYGSENTLMMSSTAKKYYWVLGFVRGVDLKEYLPYYENVYSLQGDHVPIVRWRKNNHLYIVRAESDDNYGVIDMEFGSVWSWMRSDEAEFVRYATQEELDWANDILSGDE